jgi:glycosyltransferase involved in cell wall biosynthesis
MVNNDLGVVVNPSDHPKLINTLKLLIDNPELRQTLGQKSRRFAEAHFNVSEHRQFLYETFAQLCQRPTEI